MKRPLSQFEELRAKMRPQVFRASLLVIAAVVLLLLWELLRLAR